MKLLILVITCIFLIIVCVGCDKDDKLSEDPNQSSYETNIDWEHWQE